MTTDRSQRTRIQPVVGEVIHGWDPYRLLEIGAAGDEWDHEILQIIERVNRIASPADAARVISEVFAEAFHPEGFGRDDCAEVGRKLFSALKDAGLIQTAEEAGGG